jgi:hypothetical protein
MADAAPKFDPKLLQAQWLLGGIEPHELVAQAILALEHGFSGSALQQIAGLSSPARRDLGRLPERAFQEMGLQPMDKSQAAMYAVEHYTHSGSPLISDLVKLFPSFASRWEEHVAESGGGPAGPYVDMGEFVQSVVKDLYEKGALSEVRRVFEHMENFLTQNDNETKNLIALGFFETLQCIASHRPYGNRAFEPFLDPISRKFWEELRVVWHGKSSLMDVIRAERLRSEEK